MSYNYLCISLPISLFFPSGISTDSCGFSFFTFFFILFAPHNFLLLCERSLIYFIIVIYSSAPLQCLVIECFISLTLFYMLFFHQLFFVSASLSLHPLFMGFHFALLKHTLKIPFRLFCILVL